MDVLQHIDCELNDSDVSEVTEDGLSNANNEADHCELSYELDVTISSLTSSVQMPVWIQSLTLIIIMYVIIIV